MSPMTVAFASPSCLGQGLLRPSTTRFRHRTSLSKLRSPTMVTGPPFEGTNLFVKAGPDITKIGDCPFSAKAYLALLFRNVDLNVHYINLADKPQWFLDMTEAGSVPVFLQDAHAIGDSDEIVDHADTIGSGDLVLNREKDPNWDKAFEAVSPIFGSMVRFLKNKDQNEEQKLKEALEDAFASLNSYLQSVEGPYLLGQQVSALDCNLAPKLKHASVAPKHYKNFDIPSQNTAVIQYLTHFQQLDQWKATACPDDVIVWGWSKFFK